MIRLPRFQFFYQTRELLNFFSGLFARLSQDDNLLEDFLKRMREIFHRQHACLFSSYRIALYHVLGALDLNHDDEVLLTPLTIADSVNSIKLIGLKPILIDLDPDTHCLDINDLKKKVTSRSKVLIVTYLSGIVPDLDQILKFAKANHLFVIEDFSQAVDARQGEAPIGSLADVSIASLSIGKNISTLFGGLILTDDEKISFKLAQVIPSLPPAKDVVRFYYLTCLKVQLVTSPKIFPFFIFPILNLIGFFQSRFPPDFDHDPPKSSNLFRSSCPEARISYPPSFHVRVSDFQIRLAYHQIAQLKAATLKRRKLAEILLSHFSEVTLRFVPKALFKIQENNFYHFPIYCDGKKKELRAFLFKQGIDTGSYGLNLLTEEKVFDFNEHTPVAAKVKHDTIFLPLHESRTESEMRYLAQSVNEFFAWF
jgi:perosamine synthetase